MTEKQKGIKIVHVTGIKEKQRENKEKLHVQGCQNWARSGSDWPSQNVLNGDLQKSQICPISCKSDTLWTQI